MLGNPKTLFAKALRGKYAIGAFNVNNLEFIQAIVAAAEATRAPVILQTTEGAIQYAGMDELLALMRLAAARAKVPVITHLDHGKNLAVVQRAIRAGYASVMYDGSALPYEENVRNTARIVKLARRASVWVEAELGALSGVEDLVAVAERDAVLTNPEQALDFVERTKCDALAIAIGTSHGAHKFHDAPKLDIQRLRHIHARIPRTPLVLHGASSVPEELVGETRLYCSMLGDCARLDGAKGVPDSELRRTLAFGITKVNTDTDLRIAFTAGLRESLIEQLREIDPRKLLAPARKKVQEIAGQRIRAFGSRGKA